MNKKYSYGQIKTVKVLLYISSSGSYHQRMEQTISDLLVKQDSAIMMGHRSVRQRIGPTYNIDFNNSAIFTLLGNFLVC